ncbi:conserved Plasmodium protein, unknown function [Plasmodium sp. gorilla clade G2]|uniref:conserved Plasmodium protein, unknown function n=1 Tax=Plasmodium sp. gorilla clade G2 TaxID=880535 RepID=UPI000D20A3AD|nr:conserved Plasmodium protein, unknown function [Plasmodium sp. gorilla clade G2]SOV11543.1 conserved Plasmodium protein, unknown function [Plasmodium sp. gorilla clade G2]
MGNSCKNIIRTRRENYSADIYNERFDFRKDVNCHVDKLKYFNDIYVKKKEKYDNIKRKEDDKISCSSIDDDCYLIENNTVGYVDELYHILGNKKRITIKKKVDDKSDMEEYLIIEKHMKVKRKKKKAKDKKYKEEIEKYIIKDEQNKMSEKKKINHKTKDKMIKYDKDNIYVEKNYKIYNKSKDDLFIFPSQDKNNNNNKKNDNKKNNNKKNNKSRSHSKNTEMETWCSSSNDKYDIFEQDRRYLLKKRKENTDMKNKENHEKESQHDNSNNSSDKKFYKTNKKYKDPFE